jgi:hypothetical protein
MRPVALLSGIVIVVSVAASPRVEAQTPQGESPQQICNAVVIATAATAAPPPPSGGTPSQNARSTNSDDGIRCHLASTSGSSSGSSGAALVSAGRTGGTGTKYEPYDRVVTGPDGSGCVTTGYKEVGTGRPADGAVPINEQQFPPGAGPETDPYKFYYEEYPPCPEQPRAPGEPAPVVTRAMVAAQFWQEVALPYPAPKIEPGRAITGLTAFLETRGKITDTFNKDTVFGPLQIVSTGRYYVDWGDGKGETGPYSTEGGAWPDGQITHQYTHVGTYSIQVTEKWVGQWQLGGESGTLRTLETSGTIANFPVQQIQAVIGR